MYWYYFEEGCILGYKNNSLKKNGTFFRTNANPCLVSQYKEHNALSYFWL
jgi:hypothetical protein